MFWIKNTILLLCDEAIVSYCYWLAVITIWFHCSLTKLLYASWFLSSVTTTWPVKNLSGGGTGVVICLEQDADMHMSQLMPLPLTISCFSKIQIGFTFLVPAHPGSPGCVCVCVLLRHGLSAICNYAEKYLPLQNLNIACKLCLLINIYFTESSSSWGTENCQQLLMISDWYWTQCLRWASCMTILLQFYEFFKVHYRSAKGRH